LCYEGKVAEQSANGQRSPLTWGGEEVRKFRAILQRDVQLVAILNELTKSFGQVSGRSILQKDFQSER